MGGRKKLFIVSFGGPAKDKNIKCCFFVVVVVVVVVVCFLF
jgi:hypothetical protein